MEIEKIKEFALSIARPSRIHGLSHWQRVEQNGITLAKETGANMLVVRLFAYLHDSCRLDDYRDIDHGPRASELTKSLRNGLLSELTEKEYIQLSFACENHTRLLRSEDETVNTCFDADRLDLTRLGKKIRPELMATQLGASMAIKADPLNRDLSEIIVNYQRQRNPNLEPVKKSDSDNLLSKACSGTWADNNKIYCDRNLKRILDRHIVCSVGFSESEGYAYAFFPKPTGDTELCFISGTPVIYDKTAVNEKLKLFDHRYSNADTYKVSYETDPNHLYRGMSTMEFQNMVKSGFMESNQSENGPQQNFTCFTPLQFYAMAYANPSFIFRDRPSFGNPNYTVKLLRYGLDIGTVGTGFEAEVGVKGKIPIMNLVEAWEFRLLASSAGLMFIKEDPRGEITSGGPWYNMEQMKGIRKFSENEIRDIQNAIDTEI